MVTAPFNQSSRFFRWPAGGNVRVALALLIVGLVSGCAGRGNRELLELRLRGQQAELAQLHTQLQQKESELATSRRETEILRSQLAADAPRSLVAEQTHLLARIAGIEIDSLLTGGIDRDDVDGDDALSVVVNVHDSRGDGLKVPGTIVFVLFDRANQTDPAIGRWSLSPEEVLQAWHRGLIGSGYCFTLPWQRVPASTELELHAQFTTLDQRIFEADMAVRIHPPPTVAQLQ